MMEMQLSDSADKASVLLSVSPSSSQQGAAPCPQSGQTASTGTGPPLSDSDLGLLPHFLPRCVELMTCANGSVSSKARVPGSGFFL